MRARSVAAFALSLLGVANACIDADERTLNAGQSGGGSAGVAGAGAARPDSGENGGAPEGGVAGSASDAGSPHRAGAGAEPTGGSPLSEGGAAGENTGGGGAAGTGTGPVDEGILSEWALWSVPNSPGHNWPNLFNYDADDADVTVDQVTGLSWQKHAPGTAVTWQAAMDACEALSVGGYEDWRLPTRMELLSILDYDKESPATDSVAFPDTKADYYWASTAAAAAPTRHWQVDFASGSIFPEDSAQKYYARCVRGKTKAPATHYAAGAGVVTDNYTHLMWEMPKPAEKQTLADAQLRCEKLNLGGASDWRLPSMNELQTLVDVTAINPALDTSVFTDESGESGAMDWTMSTTSFGNYWVVQWEGGVTPSVGEQSDHRSRCVRVIP